MIIIQQNKDNFRVYDGSKINLFNHHSINTYGTHVLNDIWSIEYSGDDFVGTTIDDLKILPETISVLNEYQSNKKDLLTLLNAILDGKYSEEYIVEKRNEGFHYGEKLYYNDGYAVIFKDQPDLEILENEPLWTEVQSFEGRTESPLS